MKKHSFVLNEKQWVVVLKMLDMAYEAISWNMENCYDEMTEEEHHELCSIKYDIKDVLGAVSSQGIVAMMEFDGEMNDPPNLGENVLPFRIKNNKMKNKPL
jgi:hypothetical protein